MFKIRKNIFETNSSSVHSISFCSKDNWEKFRSGEYYTDCNLEANFFTEEEVRKIIINSYDYKYYKDDDRINSDSKEIRDEFYKIFNFYTYNSMGYEFETYHVSHTTKSGEKLYVFGYYGYD